MSYWTRWARVEKGNPNRHASGRFTDSDGARQSRQASEFVDSLADDPNKEGYKASPIPIYAGTIGPVDRSKYSMQSANVESLKTRQPFINAKKVRQFDRSKLPKDDTQHPLVIKTRDNQLVVDNGNHRVSHMMAIGMKQTPVRVIHEIDGYAGKGNASP